MTGLLFILGFVFFTAFLRRSDAPKIREAIIKASLALGVWIVAVTEITSAANLLTQPVLVTVYAIAACTGIAYLFASCRVASVKPAFSRVASSWRSLDNEERLLVILCALIVFSTFVNALFAAPNNYDSMAYHMARVAEWIHHGNVRYYSTWNGKQNFDSPFAEFAVLHLQLLAGSDRFANLAQWQAFLMSAVAASLVAREFGQARRIQILASLVVLTVPMAILQSTSTQNDLVAATLCLSFAFFLIKWLRTATIGPAIFSGIGLGLAVLSKPTSDFWCLPLGVLLAPTSHLVTEKTKRSRWLGHLMLTLAIALSLNAGVFARNWHTYHSPLADPSPESYSVEHPSLYSLFSVALRNIALHFRTPLGVVNTTASKVVHAVLGSRINDPATTYYGANMKFDFTKNMDDASNPLHLLLGAISLAMIPWVRTRRRLQLFCFGGSIILGNVLFSFVLKWQPWGSRLQLAFFMLAAPVIAMAMGVAAGKLPRSLVYFLTAAIVCVFAVLFRADMRDDVVYWTVAGMAAWMLIQAGLGKTTLGFGGAGLALLATAYYCLPATGTLGRIIGALMLGLLFILAAVALAKSPAPGGILVMPCAFVLFAYAVTFTLVNPDHPLFPYNQEWVFTSPRFWQYSRYHKERFDAYRSAVAIALEQGGGDIGLFLRGDDPEYLFWVLAGNDGINRPPAFRHVGVTGRWAETGPGEPPPQAVLATKLPAEGHLLGRAYSTIYTSPYSSAPLFVLKLQDATR